MSIQEMIVEDIDEIVILEHELFSSPWSKEDFIYELTANPLAKYLTLKVKETIVGYIGFWLLYDQTQITTIGVKESEQGKGYARQLMDACMTITKELKYPKMSLEVRVSNSKAIALYESYDFINVAVRKNYYQDTHEDAYVMVKQWEVE